MNCCKLAYFHSKVTSYRFRASDRLTKPIVLKVKELRNEASFNLPFDMYVDLFCSE